MNERSTIWDCFDVGAMILSSLYGSKNEGTPAERKFKPDSPAWQALRKRKDARSKRSWHRPLEATLVGLRGTKVLFFGESPFGARYRRHLGGDEPLGCAEQARDWRLSAAKYGGSHCVNIARHGACTNDKLRDTNMRFGIRVGPPVRFV